jgi:hypothetical protein
MGVPFFDTIEEVDDFLMEECEYSEETVKHWDKDEKFKRLLEWEGLIGYEEYIKNWVRILKIK